MLLKDKSEIPPSEDTAQSLENLTPELEQEVFTTQSKPKVPLWKLPLQAWNNISVRWKLSILLFLASGIPVLIVTQTLVKSSEESSLKTLKTTVKEKGSFFVSEYVMWTNSESRQGAEAIAKSVEDANFNVSDANELAAKRSLLQPLLQINGEGVDPESIKNIKLITDNTGKSIEGNVLVLDEDFTKFPQLADKSKEELVPQSYKQQVALPSSNLANLPIVKNAIATGKPMYGIELVKASDLQALGLEKQANIGIRPQITQGLQESKQPAPTGSYEIEQGKSGLVSMAVYPIKVKGRVVGTAVVGSLLNRNYGIVDKFSKRYNMPTATIFAQDWRVSTNVPYIDPNTKSPDKTRAIGTRAAREVSDVVLQQGQQYVGETNITGVNYLTFYAPLYDHRKLLDPNSKPVGIAYVGLPLVEVQELLASLSNTGYLISIISIIIASAIGIVIAVSFATPLQRLSGFTQKIGRGEMGERLADSDRLDEIGTLSQELNNMAHQLEVLIAEKQLEAERIAAARQEVTQTEAELRIQEQRQAKEFLQQRALELLIEVDPISRGDLTIRAKVTEDEIGTIADSYNSTIRNLRKLVLEVQKASQSVSQTVTENEQTVQSVSIGANQQLQAITETLERIHTLTESIEGVEIFAAQAKEQVDYANQALIEGDAAMNSTVAGFMAIRDTVSETADKVKLLGEASQKISKVVKLISGFAAQTNMLALNASIEAARAGEEGQGFGVVANEVRALAQRSAKATTEIRQLIEEIQAQTNELIQAMEIGTAQVNDGSQLVEESRQKLTDISSSSQSVNQLVEEIARSASVQAQTSEEVSHTIQNVALIASNNSNQTESLNEAFSELLKVAQELQVSVSQFKVS
ncbi:methyl-accepting chemotaxis protein [Pseudanabaena sp. ABRG5-3]|uniref:methyl-accepting chemotaxis protein n=1 Tax=Pseudanabaena sp. ABRG5-3 TaxID=685565 RepID=UPI000DC74178|nr:methyl-accepting chemotaxis protein [Pseudanabaena sp. ABRG5-3]BBC24396.1 methyl-accepting chemotaxis protein [Pseudanabaena sp. ABRG5-3]